MEILTVLLVLTLVHAVLYGFRLTLACIIGITPTVLFVWLLLGGPGVLR